MCVRFRYKCFMHILTLLIFFFSLFSFFTFQICFFLLLFLRLLFLFFTNYIFLCRAIEGREGEREGKIFDGNDGTRKIKKSTLDPSLLLFRTFYWIFYLFSVVCRNFVYLRKNKMHTCISAGTGGCNRER